MDQEFWHRRWADNQIGFHESQVNPLLVTHFNVLQLPQGARVFLPLCGKTLDIDWLLERGNRVAGVELSGLAVTRLFQRLGAAPVVERRGGLERHSAMGVDVFVGDFFQLDAETLGLVDAVYDRAALVALPAETRKRYASHLRTLTRDAPQLLVTLEYDQQLVAGPPFAVSAEELKEMYPDRSPSVLFREHQPLGLKGRFPVTEVIWRL
jgi:thiopurine S-methyltransferase